MTLQTETIGNFNGHSTLTELLIDQLRDDPLFTALLGTGLDRDWVLTVIEVLIKDRAKKPPSAWDKR